MDAKKQQIKALFTQKKGQDMSHAQFALAVARILSASYMLDMEVLGILANYRGGILKASPLKGHLNSLKAASKNIHTWMKNNLEMKQAQDFINDCKDNAEGMGILFDGLVICQVGKKQALLDDLVKLVEHYAYKADENQSQNPENQA